MLKVNIHEAKAKLSEFIEAVERGERVVICRRNRPVAELRAIAAGRTVMRPLGASVPAFDVPSSFFAPLPDQLLDDFEGMTEPARDVAVAERPASQHGGEPARRRRRSGR
jgi:antitoxin (DNA-binding transcriptional repressor) of toxin-antitoxin stability system